MSGLSTAILYQEDIKKIKPDFQAVKFLSKQIAEKAQAIIYQRKGNMLSLLTTNNFPDELQELKRKIEAKGYTLEMFYTTTDGFYDAMHRYEKISQVEQEEKKEYQKIQTAEGNSAIEQLQQLFNKRVGMDAGNFILEFIRLSFQTGASDLHFQSEYQKVRARVRIDGVLQDIVTFSNQEFEKYLQKIKFISGVKMNIIAVPQDGRFTFEASNPIGEKRKIDARVNLIPGINAESIVIRFLDSMQGIKTLNEAGFEGKNYEKIKKYLNLSGGIIIFTGPTGSGKTTSLYSILNTMNSGKEKIITLEDPIEYQLQGIQQSQIDKSKGYTFEEGLHAILRHDPDIILVGETRSKESAEITINAALTGHKVFTTLHTDSAITAIPRLINMGIKPYMLAPALNLIVSQRLVRRVCPDCKTKRNLTYGEKEQVRQVLQNLVHNDHQYQAMLDQIDVLQLEVGTGCKSCNSTGYKGRIAIIEIFETSDAIKKLMLTGGNITDIYSQARSEGFMTLEEDGVIKALQGATTLDEIRRVL